MGAYFSFVSSNTFIRAFFAFITAIDLLSIYAVVFDRELPGRIAEWFFGALSRQRVAVHRSKSAQKINWLVFAFVCAVPPAAWLVFELYFAKRAG